MAVNRGVVSTAIIFSLIVQSIYLKQLATDSFKHNTSRLVVNGYGSML